MSSGGITDNFSRNCWWVMLAAALPLVGFWSTGLMDMDEGFYGAVAQEMISRGDWVVPWYNGLPWFEKPILIYWTVIPSIQAFGEEWGPRLPSVLAHLALVILIIRFGRKHFGEKAGLISGIVYGGSFLAALIGRLMLTDSLLALCFAACLIVFWESTLVDGRRRLWLMASSGALLGLTVLAKGPSFGIMFLLIVGLMIWRMPELKPRLSGGWLLGAGACLTVISTWYVPAWLAQPDLFVSEFLVAQNLGRFQGGDAAHQTPLWSYPFYFPLVLLIGLQPWLISGIRDGLFKKETRSSPLHHYLWIWFLVLLGVFSVSGTKLPHYILPAIAPASLLLGAVLSERVDGRRLAAVAGGWAVVLSSVLFFGVGYWYRIESAELHAVIKEVRDRPEPLIVYRVGGGDGKDKVTGQLQETSRPSILFYLKRTAFMTADDDLFAAAVDQPTLVLTLNNRLDEEGLAALRLEGERLDLQSQPDDWRVWLVTPALRDPSAPAR